VSTILLAALYGSVAAVGALGCAPHAAEEGSRFPEAGDPIERPISFQSGSVRLVGNLTIPDTDGPFPAVVLISGSGPQDRDGAIEGFFPGYRPSRDLAMGLARHGIASLRYDERGVGESTGSHALASGSEFANDAAAAFRRLRRIPDIDRERVGFVGHSEGASIAAMVAARTADVAFIVALAGPGVSGYELGLAQSEHALRAAGLEGEAYETAMAAVKEQYTLVRDGDWAKLESMVREVLPAQLESMSPEARARLGTEEDIIDEELSRMKHWARFFVTHDPSDDWARVRAPSLILLGELDVQVSVALNLAPLERALRRSAVDDWSVRVVPQANHLFQRAQTGAVEEYVTLPPHVSPDVIEAISSWILARVRPRPFQ